MHDAEAVVASVNRAISGCEAYMRRAVEIVIRAAVRKFTGWWQKNAGTGDFIRAEVGSAIRRGSEKVDEVVDGINVVRALRIQRRFAQRVKPLQRLSARGISATIERTIRLVKLVLDDPVFAIDGRVAIFGLTQPRR